METLHSTPEVAAANVVAQPEPARYYRVLVSRRDQKWFRTSRLWSARAALNVYAGMAQGFCDPEGGFSEETKIELLSVSASGVGHIVGPAEFQALNASVLAEIETASEQSHFPT